MKNVPASWLLGMRCLLAATALFFNPRSAIAQDKLHQSDRQPVDHRSSDKHASHSSFSLLIPAAMSDRDADRLQAALALNESQSVIWRDLYQTYRTSIAEKQAQSFPDLQKKATALSSLSADPALAEVFLEQFADYYRQRTVVVDAMRSQETELFDEIMAQLHDSQQSALLRARWERERRWGEVHASRMRFSNIDLTVLIQSLDLTPDEANAIDPILSEYERQVTPHFTRRYENCDKRSMISARRGANAARLHAGLEAEESREALEVADQTIETEYAAMFRVFETACRRIGELNENFLPALVAGLPTEKGITLQDRYREAAYRGAFPDPGTLVPLLQHASASVAFDESARQQARALLNDYLVQSENVNRKIMERARQHYLDVGEGRTTTADLYDRYRTDMTKLLRSRDDLNQRALDSLRTIAPAPLPSDLATLIAERETELNHPRYKNAWRPMP